MKCPNCRNEISNSSLRCPYCNILTAAQYGNRYSTATEPVYPNDERYRTSYTEPVRPNSTRQNRNQGYNYTNTYGYGNQYTNAGQYGNEYDYYNYAANRNMQKKSNDMNVLVLSMGVVIIGLQVINIILTVVSLL